VEEIVTGDAIVLDLPCARVPTRMLARLVDMLVQVPALVIIAFLTITGEADRYFDAASAGAVLLSAYVLVLVGYPAVFETLSRGRTLGKMALGLRVVADDGGPERFRQALVRALAGVIECWAMVGVPAFITSVFSSRGKRLGDVFAGTFVIRERAPKARFASAALTLDPALAGWASTLELSALPEPLAELAASYLSRYWQLHEAARDQLGARLADDVAARVAPPPPPGIPAAAYLSAVLTERRNRELARRPAASSAWPLPAPPAPPAAPAPPAPQAPPAPAPAPAPSGFAPPE